MLVLVTLSPKKMKYEWNETLSSIDINVQGCHRIPEILVSPVFIRISDPWNKAILIIDLMHEIDFKNYDVQFGGDRILRLALVKAKPAMWPSLSPRDIPKPVLDERRCESRKAAEEHRSKLHNERVANKETMTSTLSRMLLDRQERENVEREARRLSDLARIKDELFTPKFENVREALANNDEFPVRTNGGILVVNASPAVRINREQLELE
jgi:hypothetical protein